MDSVVGGEIKGYVSQDKKRVWSEYWLIAKGQAITRITLCNIVTVRKLLVRVVCLSDSIELLLLFNNCTNT